MQACLGKPEVLVVTEVRLVKALTEYISYMIITFGTMLLHLA